MTLPFAGDDELEAIAQRFRDTLIRYRNVPFYGTLGPQILEDPEILGILRGVSVEKQLPNLLLGAVHYLLLKGEEHPLADYYVTRNASPKPPETAYPLFREFCLAHADRINQIAKTRWVQVNEVQRCTMFLPAFTMVSERENGQPLAVLEIGSSAGLLLLWDMYRYDFGIKQVGPAEADIVLSCKLSGALQPPLPETWPPVALRLGMDIAPVDLDDPDQVLWLRALVWPDQPERAERLDRAIALAKRARPTVVAGDAKTDIAQIAAQIPADAPLVIFYAGLLTTAADAAKPQIDALAQQRPVYVVGIVGKKLYLWDYQRGGDQPILLANTSGIGEWIEWVDAETSPGPLADR
ncbi:MAG: DUF2332 domain-containing protein [Chloroflexi bacterium]|nr:DUF2332 domain-containing protein [Chloroflexota bacterium]